MQLVVRFLTIRDLPVLQVHHIPFSHGIDWTLVDGTLLRYITLTFTLQLKYSRQSSRVVPEEALQTCKSLNCCIRSRSILP